MDDLKALSVVELKIKEEEIHMLTDVKKGALKLFEAVGEQVPQRIIYNSSPLKTLVVPNSDDIHP